MSNDSNVSLTDGRETLRNCGRMVQVPELTTGSYERFANLIEEAQREQIEHDVFIERAEAIHPELGEAAKILASNEMTWMGALAIRLAVLNSTGFELNAELNVNQLIEQALGAMGIVQREQSLNA